MAVLGATSLTGCSSLPSFISSGSKMIFNMATSPINWTKDTSVIEGTLRVTNGTVSPGGSFPFSSIFASRPASVSASPNTTDITVNTVPTVPITVPNSGAPDAQVQPFTLSLPTMRAHTHSYIFYTTANPSGRAPGASLRAGAATLLSTGNSGSGNAHDHTINRLHQHTIPSIGSHNHPSPGGFGITHGHSAESVSVDFRVNYVDMIICTKD
jgi:hypothetical protein